MDKLITSFAGKMPFVLEDLAFMDHAYRTIINLIGKTFYQNDTVGYILTGCEVTDGTGEGNYNVSAGLVYFGGADNELFYFPGGSIAAANTDSIRIVQDIDYDANGNKVFGNGVSRQVYQTRRCKLATTGSPYVAPGTVYPVRLQDELQRILERADVTAWTQPSSLGSYYAHTSNNELKYRRRLGNLEIKGAATATTTSQLLATLFTLPSGYRPLNEYVNYINVSFTEDSQPVQLKISTAGVVSIYSSQNINGTPVYINLIIPIT